MWNYDDVSVAIEVIKRGSFIEASRHLNIPSSTISRRVSTLEAELGIRLIERTSRKLCLTDKGKLFFEQCSPYIRGIKENIGELIARNSEMKGTITITAPVFLAHELLGDWLCEFSVLHDELKLDIILSNQYEDILEENIDIAIRVGPLNDSNFIAQYLFGSSFVLCATPSYIENHQRATQSLTSLQKEPLLLTKQHKASIRFSHHQTGDNPQLIFQAKMISNDISIIRQAVTKGLGIACLPKLSVNKQINEGSLIQLFPEYEIASHRDIYAVYPSKNYLPKTTRMLLEFIKNKAMTLDKRFSS